MVNEEKPETPFKKIVLNIKMTTTDNSLGLFIYNKYEEFSSKRLNNNIYIYHPT